MLVTPHQIVEITGARQVCGPETLPVEEVAVDSRKVVPGSMFVAFPGEHVDGNDYVTAALEAGAACIVMTRQPRAEETRAADCAGTALLVAAGSGEDFLNCLASWWRGRLSCTVIGITGSSGKSTVKELVAAVLATTYRTHATAGNLNSIIGAPMTIMSCPLDAEMMVVEMGMNNLHEIETIAATARPQLGLITNVGVGHIGLLGSRDNIARAKAELIEALPPTNDDDEYPSCLMLWGEDDYTAWFRDEVAAPRGVRVITYGTQAGDDAYCCSYELDEAGCAVGRMHLPSGAEADLHLAIPGEGGLLDALAAAEVGDVLHVPAASIADALAHVQPMAMRQQILTTPGGVTVIDDTYNANTDSMRRAIDVLCALPAARHIACLGDMGELGDRAELLHAVIGAYVAAKPVDILITVGELSHEIASTARLMGMDAAAVYEVTDADAAIEALSDLLCPGDALLIKASRSMALDACVKAVMNGC